MDNQTEKKVETTTFERLIIQLHYLGGRLGESFWYWGDSGRATYPVEDLERAKIDLESITKRPHAFYKHVDGYRIVKRTTTHYDEVMETVTAPEGSKK